MRVMLRAVSALLVAVSLQAGSAIAETEGLSAAESAKLEQRVTERWSIKATKDFEGVWEYSTPNFREVFPKALYIRKFSHMVDWELTAVKVTNYDAGAAVASVVARVMSKPTKPTSEASAVIGAVPTTIREKWMLIEGEWWHSANY